jgi:hypothetical protein
MSSTRWFTILAVTSLAILAGTVTGTASAASCAATLDASTPFAAWGDNASYVLSPGGGVSLANGASLTTACTKAPGIQSIVRFFARSTSGGGAIHVEVIVGGNKVLDGGTVTAGGSMAPVDQVVVNWDRNDHRAADLQVRLTAVGGSFDIGDVYIDPFVMKAAGVF